MLALCGLMVQVPQDTRPCKTVAAPTALALTALADTDRALSDRQVCSVDIDRTVVLMGDRSIHVEGVELPASRTQVQRCMLQVRAGDKDRSGCTSSGLQKRVLDPAGCLWRRNTAVCANSTDACP